MHPALVMALAAVLWSTGGLFIKVISADALTLAALRSIVAAATLFAIARSRGIAVPFPRTALGWSTAAIYALIMLLFVVATRLTTAANAIFLQYTAPVYVLMLEPLLLKTRFRSRDAWVVATALAGMGLFFVGRLEAGGGLGNALALGSGVCFAVFALLSRARHDDDASRWQAIAWGNVLLPAAVAGYYALSPARPVWPSGAAEIAGILFLGVVQIGVAYALFTYAIARLSALETTLVGMIEPVLNPVWVFLGAGEQPSPWAIAGAALIVGSIAVRAWLVARDEPEEPSIDVPAPS
jgi:drug/metabolite transporter (DMT)-like permease